MDVPHIHRVLSRVGNAAVMVLAVFVASLLVVGWPQRFGGHTTYVFVAGNSMLPTFRNEDLVIAHRHHTYGVGDVIVYAVPSGIAAGRLIVHRIVAGNGTSGYTTRGDNNPNPDQFHPTDADVLGSVWIHTGLGHELRTLLRWFITPWVWALAAAALGFVVAWRLLTPDDDTPRAGPT